jgi:predicted nucleic-acid-binding protein
MKNWLDQQKQEESSAWQEHTDILKSLIQGDLSTKTAAKKVMKSITTAKKPSISTYHFFELVLNAVAERWRDEIAKSIIELLEEIRKIPPPPNRNFADINMYIRGKRHYILLRTIFQQVR